MLVIGCEELVFVRHFVINSDLLLSSEDFSAVKMDNFSAKHRLQRIDPPLHGVDLFNMDHLIELDRTVSCECLQCLNETLWLLYRDFNVCSVMPMIFCRPWYP